MSAEVHFIYTATRGLVNESRANTQQTLVANAGSNDPPTPTIDGSTQMSRRGQRKATTVHGRWFQGDMTFPIITSKNRAQWREYMESTAEEEVHRMLHIDYSGVDEDVRDLTIFRPMNTGTFERIGAAGQAFDSYKSTITWRQING